MKNNKIYMIEILCGDTNTLIYNDSHRIGYSTYEKAKEILNEMIKQEYENLIQNKNDSDDINYSIIDYIEDDRKAYQREIHIETKDYEGLLTRYTIIEIEIENQ